MSTQEPIAGDRRALLREALRAVDEMQAKLDAAERHRNEPIAIVGIGCRFPGGVSSPEDFWRLLHDGVDAVSEVPVDRWDGEAYRRFERGGTGLPKLHGGFLDGIDRFDPHLFGISPREAASMDPQQRLVLEVSWEALEHAGQAPDRLAGTATGVFIGITTSDYAEVTRAADPTNLDVYFATGNAHNVVAGRVSYLLGLRGPSLAVDTACSSSLTAVHLACQSLRLGESNLALAGGVNVLLVPDPFVVFSRWGMMAPDGRCKTFDARADGFVRGGGLRDRRAQAIVRRPRGRRSRAGRHPRLRGQPGRRQQRAHRAQRSRPAGRCPSGAGRRRRRPRRRRLRRGPRHRHLARRSDRARGPGRRAERGPAGRPAAGGRLGQDQPRALRVGVGGGRSHQGRARARTRGDPAAPALRDAHAEGLAAAAADRPDAVATVATWRAGAAGGCELVRVQRHECPRRARATAAAGAAGGPAGDGPRGDALREDAGRRRRAGGAVCATPHRASGDDAGRPESHARRSGVRSFRTGSPSPPRPWPMPAARSQPRRRAAARPVWSPAT